MSVEEHKRHAESLGPMNCTVLTLSDAKTEKDDLSGRIMIDLLSQAGHKVVNYRVIPNDPEVVRSAIEDELKGEVDIVLTTGGTGLSRRDSTIEVVTPLLDKVLPGFGELFRVLSYNQVGSAALLSRALLGLAKGRVIACLPGSPQAVELALKELIIPELKHLIREARR